ncbi:uncharacterized protein nin isoform X3 [Stigmatopora nigra]
MDDALEQEQHEERLKELFDSFDASGRGSLCPEELADLCVSLHLEDAAPALLDVLLQGRDSLTDRVDFEQFKDALILALSSGIEASQVQEEVSSRPASPDVQPKFVKGSKRYGRRSKPELGNTISEFFQDHHDQTEDGDDTKDTCDTTIPRKRERWNADESSTEEYEAEGQLHLWNPDEPSTPQGCVAVPLKERLHQACEELDISWNGNADHSQLLALCDTLGLEISTDALRNLNGDGWIDVQDFVSVVLKSNKPPTLSASTPYRHLKRQHSTQPFDEVGRRIATPSAVMSSIATRLFSTLDDGSGFTPVESIVDAWVEEGIENGSEILKALEFSVEGKLSLSDLTSALENELLATKNGIHQAALASFKAEIRHLLERIDGELREKEKIRLDLERVERLKTQLATEVDEHHSSIEQANQLNLRKLEEEHREKLAAVRLELMKESDLIRQQAAQQREELEAEVDKIKEDESFLRDHLSISIKENRRLEMDLLDCSERLLEAQSQVTKLRGSLDNILSEKFGDLDPGSADFLMQEERIKQLRLGYEAQCRKLQDRVDELQSELQDFQSVGRPQEPGPRPLSEELESKSPAVESDPGLGSDEVHPFISMSLEAEMMLEQLKEQHVHQMDDLRTQLESKINEFNTLVEEKEDQKTAMESERWQEVQATREELASACSREQELRSQLEQLAQERTLLEEQKQEEVRMMKQELLEAQSVSAEGEDRLRNLQERHADLLADMEELQKQHASHVETLEMKNTQILQVGLKEREKKHLEERDDLEKSWLECFEREKNLMRQTNQEELSARIKETVSHLEKEHERTVKRLTEEWREQRARLEEQNDESLQTMLEDAMQRLAKEQEQKETRLQEQHDGERQYLLEQHEHREATLKQEWEQERLQLEKNYMERLAEEGEKHQTVKEELEKRLNLQEESHRKTLREMTVKHAEERNMLSGKLDKLRDNLVQDRFQLEQLSQEKIAAEHTAENFNKEVADLRLECEQLRNENGTLTDQKVRSLTDADELKRQLAELIKNNERRDLLAGEEKIKVAACVNSLEADLTKALTETSRLEDQNAHLLHKVSALEEKLTKTESMENHLGHLTDEWKDASKESRVLRKQLVKSQDKVKNMEDTLQAVNHQRACLRSDLRVMQQERDSFHQKLIVLHKQLVNTSDRNRLLELALQKCAVQSPSKKLHRETLLLKEQEASKLSLKQQHKNSQMSMLKTLEQENAFLKQELEEHKRFTKNAAAKEGHSRMDELQEENKLLKAQVERLTTHLFESFHSHFTGLLPASPCRSPRGHCPDADNAQDKAEPRMERMETRLMEIETSLRNVKLLLREKVEQLKEQEGKDCKDVLLRDLYVANGQLLDAVERPSKLAEKTRWSTGARSSLQL